MSNNTLSPPAITPNATLTDLQAAAAERKSLDERTVSAADGVIKAKTESEADDLPADNANAEPNALASLGPGRKNYLMLVFCISMFIDAAGVSATFLMTAPIGEDLHIKLANQAWILGSYSLAFASTLLFAGRLADLFPPNIIYTIGFFGLGVFYLIISFMTNDYAFYVLRALSGLLAVLTVPSSINMIIQMYPEPEEQAKKLGLFGMSGALANTIALVLAGAFVTASWRWYFRFIAILVIPFSVGAWFLMPRTKAVAEDIKGSEKWKRMDLVGVFIMIAMLVCFILAFTQAPLEGWNKPIFIAPIVISAVLLPVFLIWEHRMPHGYSLLPHNIWSLPNIFPLIIQASAPFLWFATYQLRMASYFQDALHNSAIMSAVKLLPMGVTALIVGVLTQVFPHLITRPHYVQPIASLFAFAGTMILAYSNGGHGHDYWRWIFPSEIIGTMGAMIVFIGMNTTLIQAFPLEFAGVGGSFANVIFQIGGIIGIAVQTALISTGDGQIDDWKGTQNGYFFSSGWILATGIIFGLWYRQSKMPQHAQGGAAAVV
ncbi:Drug resistance protein [Vanrija pseudolonga]|uniref:Drug resistance protein n=1 Tax=Vanrija pseudolonga TaxID=143232 RepID=A0AAF0YEB2_9TREE|nr:Drug resistance protein [Vanrija pseudolonga]